MFNPIARPQKEKVVQVEDVPHEYYTRALEKLKLGGRGIGKAKEHLPRSVNSPNCGKCYFVLILQINSDLVI